MGLLRWRCGLCIIGTGNLACNVINNTVNTTVQQCIHNSTVILAKNTFFNYIISNSRQFKSMTLARFGNHSDLSEKEVFSINFQWVHLVKWLIIVFNGTGRKGAPFMTQASRKDSFNFQSIHFIKWLIIQYVYDLPVSWSEITSIITELQNASFHLLQ